VFFINSCQKHENEPVKPKEVSTVDQAKRANVNLIQEAKQYYLNNQKRLRITADNYRFPV
jgi:hypothetical protein